MNKRGFREIQTDDEVLDAINGLYVGMLDDEEMDFFNQCVQDGLAYRSYEGTAGLLGLAKVKKTEDNSNE